MHYYVEFVPFSIEAGGATHKAYGAVCPVCLRAYYVVVGGILVHIEGILGQNVLNLIKSIMSTSSLPRPHRHRSHRHYHIHNTALELR